MSRKVREFATDYTAAWCSQQPARVAEHFAENGSLKINDAAPSVGHRATARAIGISHSWDAKAMPAGRPTQGSPNRRACRSEPGPRAGSCRLAQGGAGQAFRRITNGFWSG